MQDSDAFQINGPQVISENIDGEVVIIDLVRGTYYSTTLVGADIWGFVQAGSTVGEIARAVRDRYEVNGEAVEEKVSGFLRELESETLIVRVPEPGNGKSQEARAPIETGTGSRLPFASPSLNKYTDMQDMLLLDPIHDVEASGWPAPKDES